MPERDDIVGASGADAYRFGRFRLQVKERRLYADDAPVTISSRALDILILLIEARGRIVTREEIHRRAWGDIHIDPTNIGVQISALRRSLADAADDPRWIATVTGRGFQFVGQVSVEASGAARAPAGQGASATTPWKPRGPYFAAGSRRWRPVVAAGGVLAVAACLSVFLRFGTAPVENAAFQPPPQSVAVLAFTDLSGDASQTYFADGLSEELIDTLAHIPGLLVAARSSSFLFKGGQETAQGIGRKLNVRAVLEGSVRRDGQHLRMTAQLVDTKTGYAFWSRGYDRDVSGVLQLQADLSGAVAQSLEVSLLGDAAKTLTADGTANAAAFDAYLRGVTQSRYYSETSTRTALAAFDEAIRLDPHFANARAGRAEMLNAIASNWTNPGPDTEALRQQALQEAETAIALAPLSAVAHAARASILMGRLEFRDAERDIGRAHELGPGILDVESRYALIEAIMGHRKEAERAAQTVVRLDPLTSASYYSLATVLYYSRAYDEALAALQREAALGPADQTRSNSLRAFLHLAQNRPDLALEDCQAACSAEPRIIARFLLGQTEAADQLAAAARRAGDWDCISDLLVNAALGRADKAIAALEQAYRERNENLSSLKLPVFDSLRGMGRFQGIERAIGFRSEDGGTSQFADDWQRR